MHKIKLDLELAEPRQDKHWPMYSVIEKVIRFIKRHKYKILLSVFALRFVFPIYNGRSWIYYYVKGKYTYEKLNTVSIKSMYLTLKAEIGELIHAKSLSNFIDELFDVFHVLLLLFFTILPIPILKYIGPCLAWFAAIKCSNRYRTTGCIRSLNNCFKGRHNCDNICVAHTLDVINKIIWRLK